MEEKFYAYLNIENPLVAWEVAIGRIISASTDFTEFGVSIWHYNMLRKLAVKGGNRSFLGELKLERLRHQHFPGHVSRMRGIYFFENREIAEAALDRWNLAKFKRYISEVNFEYSTISKYDSEWITANLGRDNSDDWMRPYLNGETYGVKPLNEILAYGKGVVLNQELRSEAYKNIMHIWPDSTVLLCAATCAYQFAGMDDVAMQRPALLTDGDEIVGRSYIKMDTFNAQQDQVIAAIDQAKRGGVLPPYFLPSDRNTIFKLPDLRSQDFRLAGADLVALRDEIHQSYI